MIEVEMTDVEIREQIERTDRFIADFREVVAATAVDPASDAHRRGLRRIADTLDAVPFVMFCNLANIDAAMRGGLMEMIEVRLMCVGAGPKRDFADAMAFFAPFDALIETARRRRLQ
jgi:hypothetical protein